MGPTYNRCKNGCDDVKTVSVHLGRAAKEGGTQPTSDNTAMLEIALVLRECIDDCFSSYGHPLRDNKDTKKRLNAVIAQLRAGANEN